MKHVKVVKAVEISGKLYTNPKHAAKRWVEQAARNVIQRHLHYAGKVGTPEYARWQRAWRWSRKHWVTSNERRVWRRVLPIFERLLR